MFLRQIDEDKIRRQGIENRAAVARREIGENPIHESENLRVDAFEITDTQKASC